jgi:TolB-like protein/Flp pilus assembly protein TadD
VTSELPQPLRSVLADRYAIEREIGRGGMATVYVAHDPKHGRQVALKVLKPELAAVLGAERFLREIQVTARLSHPHILPLHDSGAVAGLLYYTMPLVEGVTLRQRLDCEGQLPIDDALTITAQVAAALDYAHRHGVIHRDIKPENILLHEGEAVVADFGLALAVEQAGGERLTETGLSLGTPAYMSPEQVAGDRDIDARSDIYSLACVLYEMLVGQPPFTGPTGRAVLARHVADPVPPIRTVRPGVSLGVAAALTRALAKAPADRFPSATAFAEALRAEPAVAEPDATSIVVLPFENLSPDPEQEYFCDGMTDEIINALTHVGALKVIARTSAFAFKDRREDVREIGRRLGVAHLLEGSVRKSGNQLRVTAQLIEAADGSHLWAERYDVEMADVFAVQDEIALAIVNALKLTLVEGERRALTKRPTDDPELYSLYLLGRYHWYRFTEEGLSTAEAYFEQALQRDPAFALAYVGAAEVLHFKPWFLDAPPRRTMPKAKVYLRKALELDPLQGEAHAVAGRISLFFDWDRDAAERAFARAVELSPNSPMIRDHYADFLVLTGRHENATGEIQRARSLDPLNLFINVHAGELLLHARRYDEAIEELHRAVAMEPNHYYTHALLGWTYVLKGMRDDAAEELEKALELSRRAPIVVFGLANLYWKMDRRSRADELLAELEERAQRQYVAPCYLFSMYKTRGDLDRALEWFERAVDERDVALPFCLSWPGDSLSIPDDPRFAAALERIWSPAH